MGEGPAPRVSVVIPVFDAGDYLCRCLDSLVAQDLDPHDLEVVAVDDGATDGSGEVLDRYAAAHPNIRVIHQPNSGWPGRPRNVGLAASTGRYVFFVDADDAVGPQAVRRLADFADAHGSDVVLPTTVAAQHGRRGELFDRTEVDADLTRAFTSLMALKLFRRDFLERHGLRFPEGHVRLEDGVFMARAYLLADRVSVLAGYDYYVKYVREDGRNISARLGDPSAYIGSVARIIDTVREHADDPHLADRVVAGVYERKGLKHFHPARFFQQRPRRLKAWFAAAHELAATRIPPEVERLLPLDARLRSQCVRLGDLRALRALVALQRDGVEPRVRLRGGRVLLRLRHTTTDVLDVTDDAVLEAALWGLRTQRRGVRVHGAARLQALRIDRLPLTVAVQAAQWRREARVQTRPGPGPWHTFRARIPAPPDGAPATVSLRLDAPGTVIEAPLVALPPALPWAARQRALGPPRRVAARVARRWARRG
jgi:glycosyltransferase involved in cell wall biosynthesis